VQLAELYVSVQPDTSKFGPRLVRELERKYRNKAISIAVKPDTKRFTAEVTRTSARAGRSAGRSFRDQFRSAASGYSSGLDKGLRGIAGIGARVLGSAAKVAAVGVGAATAAIGVGLAKATQKAGAFDKTMRQAGQTMQASGGQLKSLTDLAIEMGAKTSFSAKGAADAMYELAKGGMRPAQIAGGALEETLVLAAAGGLELGDSAEYMVKSLGAFHLKARDAKRVSSALAGAANASSASVQDMGLALAQVSATAASSGQSIEMTTAALAAFHNAGIRGSDAGTSLKTMLARLVPMTEKARGKFKELGLITKDGGNQFFTASGKMKPLNEIAGILQKSLKGLSTEQRIAAMNILFGSDATRAATILMNEGKTGIDRYAKATSDQSQAQKLAKVATEGYAGAMERFKGALESIQIIGGKEFLPTVTSTLDKISVWIGKNQDDIKSIFTVAAGTIKDFGIQASGVFKAFAGSLTGGKTDFHSFTAAIIDSEVEITQFGSTVIETFVNAASATTGWISGTIRDLGHADLAFANTLSTVGLIAAAFAVLPTTSKSAREALINVANGAQQQAFQIRQSGNAQISLADTMDKKLVPAMEAARSKAKELAAQAVIRATVREKADAVANAVSRIGKSGDFAKHHLAGFNLETGKGTRWQEAFRSRVHDARNGLIEQYKAAVTARVGHKAFNRIVADGREKLYREFLQMGYSKDEAKRLAAQYSRVPKKIETQVKQPGMATAKSDTKSLDERINALNDKKVKIMVALGKQGFSRAGLQETVDRKRAKGGRLQGPGTGTSDSIMGVDGHGMPLARVSAGEWVINKKSSDKYDEVLNDINQDRLASGGRVKITTDTSHPAKAMREIPGQANALANSLATQVWKSYQDLVGGAGPGHGSRRRVRWHGGTFTERFANTLKSAQHIDGKYLPVIQGGFRPRTSYSGSSHAGDAVDTVWNSGRLSAMRRAGVYAWHRTPAQGPWGHHIHGIPKKGYGYPAGSGKWQQGDAARGGNGLKVGGSYQTAGWAKVGERGPELIQGNKGDKVTPLNQPISIRLDLGEDLRYYVEGLIDDNNAFHQSMGKLSR
jgi:TP901 family phage tail tape measure protein